MKKRLMRSAAMLLAVLTALCLLCACAREGSPFDPDKPEDKIPAADDPAFKAGIWTARINGIEDAYFYFNAGEMSGQRISLYSGMGVGFDYEREIPEKAVFNFGASDVTDDCAVTVTGENHMSLAFADAVYEMEYLTDDMDYKWYSNEELEQMALKYYAANNDGYIPGCCGSAINEDGLVSIQLYDRLEDHNSTAAWYTIDRHTAAGKEDALEGTVDLSPFAADR